MSPAGWLLLAAIALAVAAGWCAGAQTALARADSDGLDRYGSLLTLIRVCAEVSGAVLVTLAFAHWLGGGWQVFLPAAGLLLVARYVLIGVGPRAMGRRRAERVAAAASRLLRPLHAALGPLARLLDAVTGALPFGGHGGDPELNGRPGVEDLVDYIESQDEIEPGEREMVRSVVELGDTIVREVMVPRTDMVFVERDKTLDQALSLALRSGFSRIPVTGESTDDVVGIAYLKDIVAWIHEHPDAEEAERVEKVMRPATYVPDSKPVDELLRQMQQQRIHVAIVIDEYGGTAGPGHDRGHPRGDRRRDRRRVRQRARPGRVAGPGHRPGHGPPPGRRPRGALRRHGRGRGRGDGRRPARARAGPRPDRRLRGDGGGPAPDGGEPGRPPQQAGHGPHRARVPTRDHS